MFSWLLQHFVWPSSFSLHILQKSRGTRAEIATPLVARRRGDFNSTLTFFYSATFVFYQTSPLHIKQNLFRGGSRWKAILLIWWMFFFFLIWSFPGALFALYINICYFINMNLLSMWSSGRLSWLRRGVYSTSHSWILPRCDLGDDTNRRVFKGYLNII